MTPRLLTRFGDHFYAFDKPAGMAVHQNAEGLPDLVTWIKKQKALPNNLKPGHRLDRATSGVVLCGAGGPARASIGRWMSEGTTKRYLALVAGVPKDEKGAFTQPLKDARRKKTLAAITRYRIREGLRGFTLLELELVTGRKHQLRRHLAHAGLPVVGDTRYGPRKPKRIPHFPDRLWLHAWRLTLPDGRDLTAPLPDLLEHQLQQLR